MANLLKEYLQDIGQYDVLTAEEEVELANRIEIGKGAKQDLEENGDRYSPEEKSNLYDLIRSGEDAREDMINHNLKLVVSIAKNYHNAHLDLLDLIQEGNMGLMIAVEKFDPSFNCRFSTCATPWIKQAITKSIIDKGKNIRIPAHIFQLLSKYRQLLEELSREGIETPEPELIAERLGIDMDKVKELETVSKRQREKFNTASVAYDESTGKYYYGRNNGIEKNGTSKNSILFGDSTHDGILPKHSLNDYKIGNCAEVDAINIALNAGAKLENLHLTTIHTTSGSMGQKKPACQNCTYSFRGRIRRNYTGWYKED